MSNIVKCQNEVTTENMVAFQQMMARIQNDRAAGLLSEVENDLVLKIRYVIIPLSAAGNISATQVQANHSVINSNFISLQNSSLVPQTTHYPYRSIMSDPGIAFEPLDANEVTEANGHILRMSTPSSPPSSYSNVEDLEAEFKAQGGTVEAGVVYVYISTLTSSSSGTLLGVAKNIPSNACALHYGTVGSATYPGTLAGYDEGKTAVHELGHCFGLYHPFPSTDNTCTSTETLFIHSQNPQSPLQINPNSYSNINLVSSSDNGLDNRGRDYLRFCTGSSDCSANTSVGLKPGDSTSVAAYSCATRAELATASTPYETFMIFMDYGDDSAMQGFPSFTADTMRTVITGNSDLFTYATIPSLSVSPVFPSVADSTSSGGFPTWAIIVISVVGGLIVIGLMVWGFKYKFSTGGRTKHAIAYDTPFASLQYV